MPQQRLKDVPVGHAVALELYGHYERILVSGPGEA